MNSPEAQTFYDEFVNTPDGQEAFDSARNKWEESLEARDNGEDDDTLYDEFEAAYDVWVEMSFWLQEERGLTEEQTEVFADECQEMIVAGLT